MSILRTLIRVAIVVFLMWVYLTFIAPFLLPLIGGFLTWAVSTAFLFLINYVANNIGFTLFDVS